MPATVPITTFSGAAPPWSLLSLDANFAGIASALANPQIGVSQSADSGGVNALIGTPSPAWPSYVSGTLITITPANTNTGNTTLNVSGLGTRSVLNPDGSQLLPGALQAGTPYLFMCGTSTFVLLGSSLVQATQGPGGTPFALRNRIINGDFRVDQRNAGASVAWNNSGGYTVDRWTAACGYGVGLGSLNAQRISNAGAAMGNPYAMAFSVATAKGALAASDSCSFTHKLEGLNIADLLFGTASAKSVTVSFTFQTSVANAVLPVAILNGAANRSYITSITTGTANTPARYSVTIPGDTTGTWATDNTAGALLIFNFGTGSTYQGTANSWQAGNFQTISGATNFMSSLSNTWQITDAQLEAGSVATPMERIGFDMQLARCMRYFERSYDYGTATGALTNNGCIQLFFLTTLTSASYGTGGYVNYKVPKRVNPNGGGTLTIYSPITGASGKIRDGQGAVDVTPLIGVNGFDGVFLYVNPGTLGATTQINLTAHFTADAEL